MWHVWGRGEVHTELRWETLSEIYRFEDLDLDRRIIFKLKLEN
jgi:hypothetical protein